MIVAELAEDVGGGDAADHQEVAAGDGLLLRPCRGPTVAAALALAACTALAARRRLGCGLAVLMIAAAVMSTLAVVMR